MLPGTVSTLTLTFLITAASGARLLARRYVVVLEKGKAIACEPRLAGERDDKRSITALADGSLLAVVGRGVVAAAGV